MGNAINSLLFPAPEASYSVDSFPDNLLLIPRPPSSHLVDKIPCLYFPHHAGSHLLIYSHGNACDLGVIARELKVYCKYLKVAHSYSPLSSSVSQFFYSWHRHHLRSMCWHMSIQGNNLFSHKVLSLLCIFRAHLARYDLDGKITVQHLAVFAVDRPQTNLF